MTSSSVITEKNMHQTTDKYIIISGTNRSEAVSRQVSQLYQSTLLAKNINAEILDLTLLPKDFLFSSLYENAGKNESFQPFRDKVKQATKLLFVIPEYNGSFPGVLKAFIDGMEFPGAFKNKKAALVGLSAGVQGAGLALSHLTDILNYCGTNVLAQKPKYASIDKNFDGSQFSNKLYHQLMEEQVEAFVSF
ncbi:MAG: chromate reductase [Cyclobacteriaceae bacterium]